MNKTQIAVAIASLFVASASATAAFAQTPPPVSSTQTTTTTTSTSNTVSNNNPPVSGDSMSNDNLSVSSDKIEQKVKQELKDHGVTPTNVSVTFEDGTATLTGTVASKRDIHKAKSAAMRVKGVKHVDTSGLQVQSQTGQSTSG